ncbi:MAG: SRPBCC family protein [Actinobacteria bacterium]|nr:SRPBCC family protein [Actinomycetota bacterium]MCL5882425.1 SRPBCC family protein [Actinomycetota bacterium]
MARLQYSADTQLTPERVIAVATDFSEDRPRWWPAIDPGVYKVHSAGNGWADVTEGSRTLGGIWAHERHEWEGTTVRARVQESNIFKGGIWQLTARPRPGGGSTVEILYDRRARGLKGHLISAALKLSKGKQLLKGLKQTLEIAAREEPEAMKKAS